MKLQIITSLHSSRLACVCVLRHSGLAAQGAGGRFSVGVVWVLLLDCGHLVWSGLWDSACAVGLVRITTHQHRSPHKLAWNWVMWRALGNAVCVCVRQTNRKEREHVCMGSFILLIILSWIIRWTHLHSAFMRCTGPNPIGYRPNLLQKLCSFQLQLRWGLCVPWCRPAYEHTCGINLDELGLRTNCHSTFPNPGVIEK